MASHSLPVRFATLARGGGLGFKTPPPSQILTDWGCLWGKGKQYNSSWTLTTMS
nr:MAG TPA: hypothetical protein [Caudoviricetes sp.]